jgi:hypothetical protein
MPIELTPEYFELPLNTYGCSAAESIRITGENSFPLATAQSAHNHK